MSNDDYNQPEMMPEASENARGRFMDAMRGNSSRSGLSFLVNLWGGRGRGGGTGKVADAIVAETGENRKSVMKRIQRKLKREDQGQAEGGPVDKGTGAIDKGIRGNTADVLRTHGSCNVSMAVWITVSSEQNPSQRTARASLRGGQAEAFAAAIETGDFDTAANIVFAAYWGDDAGEVTIHDYGEIQF